MTDYILIVDDDPDVRLLLSDTMQMLGFSSKTAVHGQQALEMIRQQRPLTIVLDLMMPVMDGYMTLAHLQAKKETRDIPVILLSALSQIDPNIRRMPGVVDVMNKGNYSITGMVAMLTKAGVVK